MATKHLRKYVLLRGSYATGGDAKKGRKPHVFRRGDIVESDRDLLKHNRPSAPKKFELYAGPSGALPADNPVAQAAAQGASELSPLHDLDARSLDELRRIAEDEGLDVSGLRSKQAIIDKIRESLNQE